MMFEQLKVTCHLTVLVIAICAQAVFTQSANKAKTKEDGSIILTDHPLEIWALVDGEETPEQTVVLNYKADEEVHLRYNLNCLSFNTTYQVRVLSSRHKVAKLVEEVVRNISCVGAVQPELDHPTAGDARPFVGTVVGDIKVKTRTGEIGRSFLYAIGKKLSGPSFTPKVHPELRRKALDYFKHNNLTLGDRDVLTGKLALHKDQVGVVMIVVIKKAGLMETIFQYVLSTAIAVATASMGLKVNIPVVKKVLKRPVGPAIGLGCQFLVMPLIAYTIAKTIPQQNAAISLGIFTCGIVPGGGLSNLFCFMLDADLSLSITMTTLSNFAALLMTPLWIFTLGTTFEDDTISLEVPYLEILKSLANVIIPVFVGVLIQIKFPKVVTKIAPYQKPFVLILILSVISLGVYTNWHVWQMVNPTAIMAGLLLPYCGYLVGGVISFFCFQTWCRVKTIAIESGVQNTAIAFLLLYMSLPPPDNQLATVGSISSAIMTPLPLFLLVVVYMLHKRSQRKKREAAGEPVDKEEEVGNGLLYSNKHWESGKRENDSCENSRCVKILVGDVGRPAICAARDRCCGDEEDELAAQEMRVGPNMDIVYTGGSDKNGNVK